MRTLLHAWGGLTKRARVRAGFRVGILLFAGAAGYVFAIQIQEGNYKLALIPGVVLLALSISEFVLADIIVDARFPPETDRFLEQLTTRLAATSTHDEVLAALDRCKRRFRGCDVNRISATLHLVVELYSGSDNSLHAGLVQISDYAGRDGGRRGRVLHATKGIVGRCVRIGSKVHVNFASADEYRRRMVEEFGFTQDETRSRTNAARSYLAYPLKIASEPRAVLYFFSTEPQVFPVAAADKDLRDAADEIAGLLRAAEILT